MNNQTAGESRATSSREEVIVNVLEERANGEIKNATIHFADEFQLKDYGIGLEFHDKKSLDEFFEKTREFYPDNSIHTDAIFVSGITVIGEWTLRITLSEPFWGRRTDTEDSRFSARSLHLAHRERQGYRVGWMD